MIIELTDLYLSQTMTTNASFLEVASRTMTTNMCLEVAGVHVAVTSFSSSLAGKVASRVNFVAMLFEILRCSCLLGHSVHSTVLRYCNVEDLHHGKYCSCLNVDEECASAQRGCGARLFVARNISALPRNVSVAGSGEEKPISLLAANASVGGCDAPGIGTP